MGFACVLKELEKGVVQTPFASAPDPLQPSVDLTKIYSKPEFTDMEMVPKSTRRGDIHKKGQHHTFIHQSTKKFTEDYKTGLKKDIAILEI